MKFTIYGSGCSKCRQLTANAEQAARGRELPYEIEKVTDVNRIVDAGVMRTPALAVDGEIVVEGRVATVEEIAKALP
jgi:small redox-active disulfide protein 2